MLHAELVSGEASTHAEHQVEYIAAPEHLAREQNALLQHPVVVERGLILLTPHIEASQLVQVLSRDLPLCVRLGLFQFSNHCDLPASLLGKVQRDACPD